MKSILQIFLNIVILLLVIIVGVGLCFCFWGPPVGGGLVALVANVFLVTLAMYSIIQLLKKLNFQTSFLVFTLWIAVLVQYSVLIATGSLAGFFYKSASQIFGTQNFNTCSVFCHMALGLFILLNIFKLQVANKKLDRSWFLVSILF